MLQTWQTTVATFFHTIQRAARLIPGVVTLRDPPPYGDQPGDSEWIAQGYAYGAQGCD